MELARAVYQMIAEFQVEERYGLSQQMRRAAVSIPSNLAEGAGRNGAKEYLHFLVSHADHWRNWRHRCNLQSCLVSPLPIMPPSICLIVLANC